MTTPATIPSRGATLAPPGPRPIGRRRAAALGGIYVTAWVIGLLVAPTAPGIDAPASAVQRFYEAHAAVAVVQSALVHGVAGVALLLIALDVRRALRTHTAAAGRWLAELAGVAGVLGAVISLVQVSFMAVMAAGIDSAAIDRTVALVRAIDTADAIKLLVLGVFVGSTSLAGHRASLPPRWLRWLGAVLAPLLPISGAAFLVDQPGLYGALYVSLPLLLVWVAGAAVACGRWTAVRS